MMRKILAAVILAVSLMMFSSATWALPGATVTYVETSTTNGWRYDYSVVNTSMDDSNFFGLLLYFQDGTTDIETFLSNMTTPSGFSGSYGNESLPGGELTTYVAAFADGPESFIAPGGIFTGFGFDVTYRLGDNPFVAYFAQGDTPYDISGTSVAGPPPVAPEPVSSVLFLIGVATLGVRGYLKKK
ncbi:MAG: hypothetical protein HZA16_06110 [Nitrospirae bacterium]|nr:hypothetical protein [Nitrospirota bacterium]